VEILKNASSSPAAVAVAAGQDLMLTCAVSRVLTGRLRVSFMRLKDLALLSVGDRRHAPDPRVAVLRSAGPPEAWTVRVRDARPSDSGRYECQVNNGPDAKPSRRSFDVTVSEADVRLEPEGDVVYVDAGSELALDCIVDAGEAAPKFIMWSKDGRKALYQVPERKGEQWRSLLVVNPATEADSGEYRCDSDLTPDGARVTVFVVSKSLHLGAKTAASESDQDVADDHSVDAHISPSSAKGLRPFYLLLAAVFVFPAMPPSG